MPSVVIDDKELYLTHEMCAYIRIYKGSKNDDDFKLLYGDDSNSLEMSLLLSNKNLNKFLNFLNNPSDELLSDTEFSDVNKLLDMVTTLIEVSADYAYVFGPIGRVLYRAEDMRNMPGYDVGELSSMKSTTAKEAVATDTFNYPNTKKLIYKVYGFCPYILVENCVDGKYFGGEEEYLFPPFVKCQIKDEQVVTRYGSTFDKVVEIYDDFSFEEDNEMSVSGDELDTLIQNFEQRVLDDKVNGRVSDTTKNLAKILNHNLRQFARNKYARYKLSYECDKEYDEKSTYDVVTGTNTFMNAHLTWDEKYRGFEDALIQYYQEPNRNWNSPETVHVYTFAHMMKSGLFNSDLLDELYGNSHSEKLDAFFLDGTYQMSQEDYSAFLNAFNVMAGYGEHKKDELREEIAHQSNLAIDKLYDNKKLSESK